MKNTFKPAAVLAALLSLSASAVQAAGLFGIDTSAVESNFGFNNGVKLYVGAGLGYANQDSGCDQLFFEGSCENGAMSAKLFGGARFNPMVGAELAYSYQGEAEMDGTAGDQEVSGKNKISGYQLTGVGYLPVNSIENLEVMGKAGVMFWNRESQLIKDGVKTSSSDDGIAPVIGLGAQYQLNKNIFLRTEWEHTFNTGADSDHETDTDNYSMGVSYSTL
ncbi:MAG: outer membrane beta-barrel protein [Thiolinea sp.]